MWIVSKRRAGRLAPQVPVTAGHTRSTPDASYTVLQLNVRRHLSTGMALVTTAPPPAPAPAPSSLHPAGSLADAAVPGRHMGVVK